LVGTAQKGLPERGVEHQDLAGSPGDAVKETGDARRETVHGALKDNARPVPLYVVNQVGRKLGLALKRGEDRVRLQLKPPHLGTIELNLAMKNNVLKLAIVSEHPAVKEIMVAHVQELKAALAEQGIQLQKVDVQIDYNSGQSMANAHKDMNSSAMWKQNGGAFSEEEQDDTLDPSPGILSRRMGTDSTLDMFA